MGRRRVVRARRFMYSLKDISYDAVGNMLLTFETWIIINSHAKCIA